VAQSQLPVEFCRPCMECAAPPDAYKPVVAGLGGLLVTRKGTDEVVGHLHASCKEAWVRKNGEAGFSFRVF